MADSYSQSSTPNTSNTDKSIADMTVGEFKEYIKRMQQLYNTPILRERFLTLTTQRGIS